MNAGKLNKRIEIQELGTKKDSDGYQVEEWATIRRLSAMVVPISAMEYNQAKATQTQNTTRFVVRYSNNLYALLKDNSKQLAILYKSGRYNVESVINDYESNESITIIGTEVV